jgi:polysaccharide biosynthesis transport protein
VFETVMNRYQTLLAERAFLEPAASIVSRAMPSARPSFPRTILFLTIAAMASLLGGAAAAVGWHLIRSASLDLTGTAAELGIRPLVAIPRFRSTRNQGVVQMRDPRLFIESVRFLRDAVFGRSNEAQTAVCLVTSVLPRQGKSLTAMSLARAVARSGRRTLFMEADLRQPTASKLARCDPPEKGLAAFLEGRASINEVVLQDESTGLHMLLAEEDASKALERLATAEVRQLLVKLRSRYDAIVIDSPPVGIVSDALTLALLADQTILVAREGACTVQDLKRGVSLLRDRGATIAGLVLTSVDPAEMSSVDRKTLDRYVKGVPAVSPVENVVGG